MRLKAAAIACEPPSTSSASSAFTSIAVILLIATAGGLAIEPRPALPATIRSAARHYHVPSLDSIPDPSAPFDLLADVNGTILTFASIIATADTLAIELSPVPLVTSWSVDNHHQHLEPGPTPGLPALLGPFADDSDTNHTLALVVASTTGGDATADVMCITRRAPIATSALPAPWLSSRHFASFVICHALTSTADADAPPGTTPSPTCPYCRMDVQNPALFRCFVLIREKKRESIKRKEKEEESN